MAQKIDSEKNIREAIALHCIRYRNQHKLTQGQFAIKINSSREVVAMIEAKRQKPRLVTIIKIADLLGISVKELSGLCVIQ